MPYEDTTSDNKISLVYVRPSCATRKYKMPALRKGGAMMFDKEVVKRHIIDKIEVLRGGCPDKPRGGVQFDAEDGMSDYLVAINIVKLIRQKLIEADSITVSLIKKGNRFTCFIFTD